MQVRSETMRSQFKTMLVQLTPLKDSNRSLSND